VTPLPFIPSPRAHLFRAEARSGARGEGTGLVQSEKQANILDATDNLTKIGEDVFTAEVKNMNPKRT
jgi:hypothetical protein